MDLRPIATEAAVRPRYPARVRARLGPGGCLRRLAAAAGAAVMLSAASCSGGPGGEEWVHMAGDIAEPVYFTCAEEEPGTYAESLTPSGSFGGSLCGDGTARGDLEVRQATVADVELTTMGEGAVALFVGPGGDEVAVLTPERPSLTIAFDEGTWAVLVDPAGPESYDWFSLAFRPVER